MDSSDLKMCIAFSFLPYVSLKKITMKLYALKKQQQQQTTDYNGNT